MKVCVTGAAGRLGPVLCARLLEDGHEVLGVDDLSTGRLEATSALRRAGGRFHRLDVAADGLADLLARDETDVLCHLALSPAAPVLEACAAAAVGRVVWAGSAEVYGPRALTERGGFAPVTEAGAAHAAAEVWVGFYERTRGLQAAVLRLGAVGAASASDAVVRCLDGAGDGRRLNIGSDLDCGAARRALGWEP